MVRASGSLDKSFCYTARMRESDAADMSAGPYILVLRAVRRRRTGAHAGRTQASPRNYSQPAARDYILFKLLKKVSPGR